VSATPLVSTPLLGDEADLYDQHHDHLVHVVRRSVFGSDALVDDACQSAWLVLMRRQPNRGPTLFGWLATTAIHEAWRLSRLEQQLGYDRDVIELAACDGRLVLDGLDTTLKARRLLRAMRALPDRSRRFLTLRVAGCSYAEIAGVTGATYTNVNKHLVRGRALLREEG